MMENSHSETGRGSLRELIRYIPGGETIPEESWEARHRNILIVLFAHIPFLRALGLYEGTESAVTGATIPEERESRIESSYGAAMMEAASAETVAETAGETVTNTEACEQTHSRRATTFERSRQRWIRQSTIFSAGTRRASMVAEVSDSSTRTAERTTTVSAAAAEQTASMSETGGTVTSLSKQAEQLQAMLSEFTVSGTGTHSSENCPRENDSAVTARLGLGGFFGAKSFRR